MKTYIATTLVTLGAEAGLVRLTPAQVKARAHNLHTTDEVGIYRIVNAVQFKRGEQFGYDGSFPKGMATVAMTPEEIKAAAEAKAKEEKKSKAAAKKKAEDDAAQAKALEQAIGVADAAVQSARAILSEQGDSANPVVAQAIEDTITAMAILADAGDHEGLSAATDTLVDQTGQLAKK